MCKCHLTGRMPGHLQLHRTGLSQQAHRGLPIRTGNHQRKLVDGLQGFLVGLDLRLDAVLNNTQGNFAQLQFNLRAQRHRADPGPCWRLLLQRHGQPQRTVSTAGQGFTHVLAQLRQ